VLTEGGVKLWAICLRCERKGGRSLRSGWTVVVAWMGAVLVVLAGLVAVLAALRR
jgi:hypothetical protein